MTVRRRRMRRYALVACGVVLLGWGVWVSVALPPLVANPAFPQTEEMDLRPSSIGPYPEDPPLPPVVRPDDLRLGDMFFSSGSTQLLKDGICTYVGSVRAGTEDVERHVAMMVVQRASRFGHTWLQVVASVPKDATGWVSAESLGSHELRECPP